MFGACVSSRATVRTASRENKRAKSREKEGTPRLITSEAANLALANRTKQVRVARSLRPYRHLAIGVVRELRYDYDSNLREGTSTRPNNNKFLIINNTTWL